MTDARKLEIIEELFAKFDTDNGDLTQEEADVIMEGLDKLFMSIKEPEREVNRLFFQPLT